MPTAIFLCMVGMKRLLSISITARVNCDCLSVIVFTKKKTTDQRYLLYPTEVEETTVWGQEGIKNEINRILADMLERVIDNFDVGVAEVIQQRGPWIEHFINYKRFEEKISILQMSLPAGTFSGTLPVKKFCKKIL